MPKSQPSFASLAAGVASRLGRLTIQAAQQARTGAAVVARKSLTQVSEMLDQAIDATSSDTEAKDTSAKSKTVSKAVTKSAVPKSKARSAKAKRK